jgi:hypothetical protein
MGDADTRDFGTIFRVRTWDHNPSSDARFTYSVGKQPKGQKTVVMMCCLGEAPIDAEEPPDIEGIMGRLGWVREKR